MENNSKPTKRVTGRPFPPGTSGNPGGRPKNQFGEFIRAETKDGKELVDRVISLMRTTDDEKMLLDTVDWLANRGWGKPIQAYEVQDDQELADLLRQARLRATRTETH